jgi:hypothetical protein
VFFNGNFCLLLCSCFDGDEYIRAQKSRDYVGIYFLTLNRFIPEELVHLRDGTCFYQKALFEEYNPYYI